MSFLKDPKYGRISQWFQWHSRTSSWPQSSSTLRLESRSKLHGRTRIQGTPQRHSALWGRRCRPGREHTSSSLSYCFLTCLQLLAVEHALLVYSIAEVDVLRSADDAVEFEDMSVGLGGREHVFALIAKVQAEDCGGRSFRLSLRCKLTLVLAIHLNINYKATTTTQ
jgi:hypothetical protein